MLLILECPVCHDRHERRDPIGLVMPRCERGACTYASLVVVERRTVKFAVEHTFYTGGFLCTVTAETCATRAEAEAKRDALRAEYAAITDNPPRPSTFEVVEVQS